MNSRFVHLGINPVGAIASQPAPAPPDNLYARLEGLFDTHALDWYRYGSQNYLLFTSISLEDLTGMIVRMPGFQNVYLLLTETPEIQALRCNGWMPMDFWQWLFKPR
ncbi:MAG TPA: hypothetical protein VN950_19010 [Terriglobales bacterium]|nr:hypothetical protein [Terriglobales bacterium]